MGLSTPQQSKPQSGGKGRIGAEGEGEGVGFTVWCITYVHLIITGAELTERIEIVWWGRGGRGG